MSDRPILFSALMVRALLAGTKTQTRRVLKPQPYSAESLVSYDRNSGKWMSCEPSPATGGTRQMDPWRPLRIKIGDRLWVREKFIPDPPSDDPCWDNHTCSYVEFSGCGSRIANVPPALRGPAFCIYAADPKWSAGNDIDWRPSIYMPRWASRLTLIVTDVRVERLQAISEADAVAEGIEAKRICGVGETWTHYGNRHAPVGWLDPRQSYQSLWDSINGAGAWEANPWVAAYTFTIHRGNIDQIGGAA